MYHINLINNLHFAIQKYETNFENKQHENPK